MPNIEEPDYTPNTESRPNETEKQGVRLGSAQTSHGGGPMDQPQSEAIQSLAHDLRTPFISIRGYTKMVLEERVGPVNSTQREYLTIVAENANKAIRLLNELLKQFESTFPEGKDDS